MKGKFMKKHREKFLDFIRGGAAICIILYHYTTRYNQMIGHKGEYSFNLPWGWMAWAVFFIMSGYLVYPKAQSIKKYIIKKAIRLYPGYWAAMGISFAVTTLYLREYSVSLKEFVVDMTMLGNYVGCKSVVGVDWTLSIDIIFYGIIALIILVERKTKRILGSKVILLWSILSCLIEIMKRTGWGNPIIKIIGILMASQYAHFFMVGHFLKNQKCDIESKKMNLIAIGFSIIAQWVAFQNMEFELFYIIFIVIFMFYIKHSKQDKINIRCKIINQIVNLFSKIASISYPLYLVHEYLGFAILKYFDSIGFSSEIFVIIPIIISIICAYIIHKHIELPIGKLKIKTSEE